MMTQKLCLFIFLISILLLSKIGEAQSIKGKIIDASNSDPLIGAVIKIHGTTLGTLSDLDGNYEVTDLKPGKYNLEFSYIGYNPKTLNDVLVSANKTTNLDVALAGEGILTEEITVEASPTLANEQSLLTEQKNSSKIQDGISEQQIKRAPDATASEVLK
ncbi:MAG: carboxypeptidase-like regulatory domain-containing protein, partial [bacterium]